MKKFNTLLEMDKKELEQELITILMNSKTEWEVDKYIFVNNGAKVTLFAHMDTINDVYNSKLNKDDYICKNNIYSVKKGTDKVLGADDRSGIWIILQLIEAGNTNYNYVFTQDEEVGGIGASKFAEDYTSFLYTQNCFISLDRRGTKEVALYGYNNKELVDIFKQYGYSEANGSYTDCVEASYVTDVACVNLSVGYNKEHTSSETVDFSVMEDVVKLLLDNELIKALTTTVFKQDNIMFEDDEGLVKVVCDSCGKHTVLYEVLWGYVCEECYLEYEDDR